MRSQLLQRLAKVKAKVSFAKTSEDGGGIPSGQGGGTSSISLPPTPATFLKNDNDMAHGIHDPDTVVSNIARASPTPPARLWESAYAKLLANPELASLVETFQQRLGEYGEINPVTTDTTALEASEVDAATRQLLRTQQLAHAKLERLSDTYLSFQVGQRKIVVREQVSKVVKFVLKFKDVISSAISAEPHAGLAWAGILVILPMLENISKQDEDALAGVELLSLWLVRYRLIEDEVISSTDKPYGRQNEEAVTTKLETQIIELYSDIYAYLMRVVVEYTRAKPIMMMSKAVCRYDWVQMVKEMKNKEEEIWKSHAILSSIAVKQSLETLAVSNDALKDLMQATVATVNASYDFSLLTSIQSADQALFDSREVRKQGKCLPGTQCATLDAIGDWLDDPDSEVIFWLHGMAGTGKTSITRTVADALDEGVPFRPLGSMPRMAVLGASFFFRLTNERMDPVEILFFTTLASSLAQRTPLLQEHVIRAISEERRFAGKDPSFQMDHLILRPLLSLSSKTEGQMLVPVRLVIVVDALDECSDDVEAQRIIEILGKLRELDGHIQVRVLIISRPEQHIKDAITDQGARFLTLTKVPPSGPGDGGKDDITVFLEHERRRIAKSRKLRPNWLCDEDIAQLREMANGLFIHAATACRFLDCRLEPESRRERLSSVLSGGLGDGTPQASLDIIYRQVLGFRTKDLRTEAEKQRAFRDLRRILGTVVVVFEPITKPALVSFSSDDQGAMFSDEWQEAVRFALDYLHSVLHVPHSNSRPLELVHLSFRDFLLDEERAEHDFFIAEFTAHEYILSKCLSVLRLELFQDMCKLQNLGTLTSDLSPSQVKKHLSTPLRYASSYWAQHLANLSKSQRWAVGLHDEGEIYKFLTTQFLYWLEALCLIAKPGTPIRAINLVLDLIDPITSPKLASLLEDAKRFVMSNQWIIENAPLQIYISALIFSPARSLIRTQFSGLIPEWIQQMPKVEEQWSPELYAVELVTRYIKTLTFSHDGKLLGVTALHQRVEVWDSRTGTIQATFEESGFAPTRIAFSPHDSVLALWSADGSIKLWHHPTGGKLEIEPAFSGGNKNRDKMLAFTADGKTLIALTHQGGPVRRWSLACQRPGALWPLVSTVVQDDRLQDLGQIVPTEGILRPSVWDIQDRAPSSRGRDTSSIYVRDAAFSARNEVLVFGWKDDSDKTDDQLEGIVLWSEKSQRTIRTFNHFCDPFAISKDGNFGASFSSHTSLDSWELSVWDVQTGNVLTTMPLVLGQLPDTIAVSHIPGDGIKLFTCWSNGASNRGRFFYFDLASASPLTPSWDLPTIITDPGGPGIEVSGDSQYLATVIGDAVQVWDLQAILSMKREETSLSPSSNIESVSLLSDDRVGIISWTYTGISYAIWDISTGSCSETHYTWGNPFMGPTSKPIFSLDGQLVALQKGNFGEEHIVVSNTNMTQVYASFDLDGEVWFSDDSQVLAILGSGRRNIRFFRREGWENKVTLTIDKHETLVYVSLSPTADFAIVVVNIGEEGGEDQEVGGALRLYNLATGNLLAASVVGRQVETKNMWLKGVLKSPNIAFSSSGNKFAFQPAWNFYMDRSLQPDWEKVSDITKLTMVDTSSGQIRDVNIPRPLSEILGESLFKHTSTVVFSKDGSRVASLLSFCPGRAHIAVIDPRTGQQIQTVLADSHINNLAISTTGLVAGVSPRGYEQKITVISLWDERSGGKIGSYEIDAIPKGIQFDSESGCLVDLIGRLPLPRSDDHAIEPDGVTKDNHFCLHVTDEWISQGFERLIWLPMRFRPSSNRDAVQVSGERVVIGASGKLICMELDLAKWR
ncbi:hypothetical protein B0T26DRAFT_838710 [Lasiosphaeria miniovina]|uniref:Vegetative incompatibility protein HET-E-1 n=1 Tax=Lasiosphaeria miniovina TaxID=1954250 RepID=A0AA39ZSR1_9PEZI|nr:uncharacterized protein B0T26DRAFT_838710 [Lasiosphaeria miniovina]KAK0702942.1 hypothetical protein B0T26DRAFT_838710 [Lasiosphaeria miniovina]